ncbi:MAG: efflux RND transporter periplasmic adaptor subunit [Armatimonadota bacterium]
MWGKRWFRILIIVFSIIVIIGAAVILFTRTETVQVVRPTRREVVELVIDSGYLRAVRQAEIGSEATGVVESVLVDEGDTIIRGQTIITLERTTSEQSVQRSRLAVITAERELQLARRGAQPEELARARAELQQAQRVGTAQLNEAVQRLRELQRGGRPEDIQRALAELQQARAARQQAELDLQRAQTLFTRGAIARADLDRAQTALTTARAAERISEQRLALTRQPASAEEIAAAKAQVQGAQATLEESVRIARENLRQLQNLPQPEEIRVAEARLNEARGAFQQSLNELAKRTIKSPINGLVISRNVEPGQSVTLGATLMEISDMSTTEIIVETDESNLPRLKVGQLALAVSPSYPDQPFRAVVSKIGPSVENERGIVDLILRPTTVPSYARPELTVDVNIEVRRINDAIAVPVSSVVTIDDTSYVYIVSGGRAERRMVDVLARGENLIAIDGISAGTPVIINGTTVSPGKPVRVVEE